MKHSIEVVFDGKSFVPTEPIDLPTGTKLTLDVPKESLNDKTLPIINTERAMSTEDDREWEELSRLWQTTPWPFSSVDEALAYSRCHPSHELLLLPDLPIPTENRKDGSD
jgi:hypothetical protein